MFRMTKIYDFNDMQTCYLLRLAFFLISGLVVHSDNHPFPKHVPVFKVRVDMNTGETVTTGKLELIGGVPKYDDLLKPKKSFPLQEVTRTLQCLPSYENDFDAHGGISLSNMAPPSANMTELTCAWLETGCTPWLECRKKVEEFKKGNFDKELKKYTGFYYWMKLYRIINGKLFYDWPWGVERFPDPGARGEIAVLYYILDKIHDIPDSVFFCGTQQTVFPPYFPFPSVTNSPSFKSAEMVFPWPESFGHALSVYKTLAAKNFSKIEVERVILNGSVPWYASMTYPFLMNIGRYHFTVCLSVQGQEEGQGRLLC